MGLERPSYIDDAVISGTSGNFEWDDLYPATIYSREVVSLENKLSAISGRGIIAFSTGCVEWVYWALNKFSDDQLTLQFIESAWAANIDFRYLNTSDRPTNEEWRGPISGAFAESMRIVMDTVEQAIDEQTSETDAVDLSNLVEHVLDEPKPFRSWRTKAIGRLAKLYPYDEDNEMGLPVPREVLEVGREFDPDATDQYLKNFVASLDPGTNRYLNSADRLKELGFPGVPYTL